LNKQIRFCDRTVDVVTRTAALPQIKTSDQITPGGASGILSQSPSSTFQLPRKLARDGDGTGIGYAAPDYVDQWLFVGEISGRFFGVFASKNRTLFSPTKRVVNFTRLYSEGPSRLLGSPDRISSKSIFLI
jgi:hypothetical protein